MVRCVACVDEEGEKIVFVGGIDADRRLGGSFRIIIFLASLLAVLL